MPEVNPAVLRWARETAGLEAEEAARKLGIPPARGETAESRLLAYEEGHSEPTRSLLLKMAKQYRRPLLTFYLDQPPQVAPRGSDFRTLPAKAQGGDEAVLDTLLRNIVARQSLLRDAMEDEDEPQPLPFVGSMRASDGVPAVVESMRGVLGITVERYRTSRNPEDGFRLMRQAAEAAGVFVLLVSDLGSHHTALDAETFRGFALADPIAPFVVINDKDSRAAWTFTLLHELAHIWLGFTGVSGSDAVQEIERFCNQVAAEYLIPAAELRNFPPSHDIPQAELVGKVTQFAAERRVSRSMVALGLMLNGRISRTQWSKLSGRFRAEWREQREIARTRGSDGSPDYYTVRRHRLGDALVSITARLLDAGALTTTKAGRVLGVKPHQVQRITTTPRQARH